MVGHTSSPWSEAAAPRNLQARGRLLFINFNRIHMVPPLTTTTEEARDSLQILDEALVEV